MFNDRKVLCWVRVWKRFPVAMLGAFLLFAGPMLAPAVGQPPLQGRYVKLVKEKDTSRTGARRVATFVRPMATPGWYYLGQLGMAAHPLKPDSQETGLVVRPNPAWRGTAPLASAANWRRNWGMSDDGGFGLYTASLPVGYQSLSDIFDETDDGPGQYFTKDFVLVHNDCLVTTQEQKWTDLWNDGGSGAREDAAVNGANYGADAKIPYTRTQFFTGNGLQIDSAQNNRWMFYRSGNSERPQYTLKPEMIEILENPPTPNDEKLRLLTICAPLLKLAKGEEYLPLSADEMASPLNTNRSQDEAGRTWLFLKAEMSGPSDDSLPLFKGDLPTAKVHAFWSEHSTGVNLVYFFFYGYNRGKEVAGSIYGNRMGDIEHIVVRLERRWEQQGRPWAPTTVYYSSLDSGNMLTWAEVNKVGGTHPIVYAAKGSHGCYPVAGDVKYKEALGTPSIDHCDDGGVQWQTWGSIVALDYNAQVNLSGGRYPAWMGPLGQPGAIYRWGNRAMSGNVGDKIVKGLTEIFKPSSTGDVERFTDGPEGPQFKPVFGEDLN